MALLLSLNRMKKAKLSQQKIKLGKSLNLEFAFTNRMEDLKRQEGGKFESVASAVSQSG